MTINRLSDQTDNALVQRYLGAGFTAHSLRASFVTMAKLAGADDSKVMNQTKYKTSAMIRHYTRLDDVKQHNAAKEPLTYYAPLLLQKLRPCSTTGSVLSLG